MAKRILLAIDDSPYSETAINAVIEHVRPSSADILVLNVVEWPLLGPPYLGFAVGSRAVQAVLDLRDAALQGAETYVTHVVTRLRTAGFVATGAVREDDPRSAIVAVASTSKADRIVMGWHGRRGLARYALGSVADSVLRRAACSVEIVRRGATESALSTAPDVAVANRPVAIDAHPKS